MSPLCCNQDSHVIKTKGNVLILIVLWALDHNKEYEIVIDKEETPWNYQSQCIKTFAVSKWLNKSFDFRLIVQDD